MVQQRSQAERERTRHGLSAIQSRKAAILTYRLPWRSKSQKSNHNVQSEVMRNGLILHTRRNRHSFPDKTFAKQSKLGWQYNCDTDSGTTIRSSLLVILVIFCTQRQYRILMACTQVASGRLYLLRNMTTHASSCRSMPCHALSETKAHQTPSLGTIAHLRGYCSTLKRHGWSMFRLPASMCISPTPTEQDFVAIRNKHVGACLYIRREDLMVVATICFCPADFAHFVHQYT